MKFGKTIRKLRKAKNLTLVEVSKRSGVQLATLSRIENLKMAGTLENHFLIAEALNIEFSDLVKEFEHDSSLQTA